MKPTSGLLLTAACAVTMALAAHAVAQPNDSNVSLNAPGFLVKKPRPGLPEVKAQPQAWPRLDPGAVLCRSEDDLNRLTERRAGQDVEGPVDCQVVRSAMAITIVQRQGPGRTEVKPSDPNATATGWTDAWLPEKRPVTATSAGR